MPAYIYLCLKCDRKFDIVKSIKSLDDPEACPGCAALETRRCLQRVNFNGASDWDKAEYNPGLGCVVKNTKHRERLAKERGLIEVGNEDVSKVIKTQDAKLESASDERFEKAFDPVLHGLKKQLGKV